MDAVLIYLPKCPWEMQRRWEHISGPSYIIKAILERALKAVWFYTKKLETSWLSEEPTSCRKSSTDTIWSYMTNALCSQANPYLQRLISIAPTIILEHETDPNHPGRCGVQPTPLHLTEPENANSLLASEIKQIKTV